jgi:hypothetical protein
MGGFTFCHRFGVADNAPVANAVMFVGLHPTTGQIANNTNTAAMVNVIGVGQVPLSNSLHIITNSAAGAAHLIDTTLQCNVGNTALWDVTMFAAPNDDKVQFAIRNLANSSQTFTTTVTSNTNNLPLGNTILTWQTWRSNNGAAAAVAIDLISLYIETDQ